MSVSRTRRRRDIEQELDEAFERPPEPAPPHQLLALQRHAGNQAVARMFHDAQRPSTAPHARRELARRAAEDESLLDAMRGAVSLRAAPGVAGTLVDPAQDSATPDVHEAHPGIMIGEGEGDVAAPGIAAPEADAQIAAVEDGVGQPPATDAPDVEMTDAPAPEPADVEMTDAPSAVPELKINSRTDMRAPDGTPDTRTKVGIGEVVYFDVGGATVDWKASAGWPPVRNGRSTYAWEMATPGSATITATDPATGATATIDIEVVMPQTLQMSKVSEDAFPAGTGGAGMMLRPRFGPSDVSFGNVEWLEQPGGPSAVTGYFATLQAAGADWNHHPNPNFLRINSSLRDHAAIFGLPSPFAAGSFRWEIPNAFRRAATTGAGQVTITSVQSFAITAAGVVTVRKQGASVTRTP